MTPRFPTLIFDLDGTLADTLPLIYEAFNDAFEPVLGKTLTGAEIRALFGPPDNYVIRDVLGPDHFEAGVQRYVDTYRRRHADLVALYVGIGELLADAQDAGVRMAVVTGKSRSTALHTLDALGVSDRFECIYAGDDVERPKPDPQALFLALDALNQADSSKAAMIGDSAADAIAGKAAGMYTIGVLWGVPDHGDLLNAEPDVICSSVDELREVLQIERFD